MKNFDVVFLLLSEVASERFGRLLELHTALVNAAFHVAIATDPDDLDRPSGRMRIVLIDGAEDATDFDPFEVTRQLRKGQRGEQRLVFIAGATERALLRARDAGADICVPEDIQGPALCEVLERLGNQHAQALVLDDLMPVAGSKRVPAPRRRSRSADRAESRSLRRRGSAIRAYRVGGKAKEESRSVPISRKPLAVITFHLARHQAAPGLVPVQLRDDIHLNVQPRPVLTQDDVQRVEVTQAAGAQVLLCFALNPQGAMRWAEVALEVQGEYLLISANGRLAGVHQVAPDYPEAMIPLSVNSLADANAILRLICPSQGQQAQVASASILPMREQPSGRWTK